MQPKTWHLCCEWKQDHSPMLRGYFSSQRRPGHWWEQHNSYLYFTRAHIALPSDGNSVHSLLTRPGFELGHHIPAFLPQSQEPWGIKKRQEDRPKTSQGKRHANRHSLPALFRNTFRFGLSPFRNTFQALFLRVLEES